MDGLLPWTLVENIVNSGILSESKIMVRHGTIGSILHTHGILGKILARIASDLP